MVVIGPMKVKSMCSHHLMPIYGKAWVAYIPKKEGRVLGLSKFPRIVDWIARRPQIQEEMTEQISRAVLDHIQVEGLAVYVESIHMCTTHRGIEDESTVMKTSIMHGMFRDSNAVREEFFSAIKG
jgi:GTP cyclohydrolase I